MLQMNRLNSSIIKNIQAVKKVPGRLYIFSGKVLLKKIMVTFEVIFNEESNGDL